jgi:LmbE family N-acetylglucosaminyl deacetylase
VRLPHLERRGGRVTFLGDPLDNELFSSVHHELWSLCDGSRAVAAFEPAQRRMLTRWYQAGMVVMAPARTAGAGVDRTGPAVVAPHPDDAQLALGGLLARDGGHVVDVFTTEVWTLRPYYRARPGLTAQLLLAEEDVACRVLDVDKTLLGFTDAAERPAWRDGFLASGPVAEGSVLREPELLGEVGERLAAALPAGRRVLVPLAVGGHVDHLLCREATLQLLDRGTLRPDQVGFYEDMPYTLFGDAGKDAGRLSERLARQGVSALRPHDIPLDGGCVSSKWEALRTYRLQVGGGMARRIMRHGSRLGAPGGHAMVERIWLP